MWKVEDRFVVRLGGNTYINVKNIVDHNGTPLFTLKRHDETGYLGIDFDIHDAKGKRVASVRRNEIYSGNKEDYKIEGSADRYTLMDKATGEVLCDIKKREEANPAELDVSVRLYTPSGWLFDATPEGTNLGDSFISGSVIMDCGVGISVR
jgi:hypothetical protein